jgi:hypothetical protein
MTDIASFVRDFSGRKNLTPGYCIALALLAFCSSAQATTFTFNTDPFAGTNVRNIPGRQILGGEDFVNFITANDVFAFNPTAFGVNSLSFANSLASNLPATGANVIVVENFDNDNNPLTPFGAGNAADLIASRVITSGPGFFIYFNQSLDLPRLVYSTDLSDTNADLRILARMLNLNGQIGRNALSTFTASNFTLTASSAPEPSSLWLILAGSALASIGYAVRRRRSCRLAEPTSGTSA